MVQFATHGGVLQCVAVPTTTTEKSLKDFERNSNNEAAQLSVIKETKQVSAKETQGVSSVLLRTLYSPFKDSLHS